MKSENDEKFDLKYIPTGGEHKIWTHKIWMPCRTLKITIEHTVYLKCHQTCTIGNLSTFTPRQSEVLNPHWVLTKCLLFLTLSKQQIFNDYWKSILIDSPHSAIVGKGPCHWVLVDLILKCYIIYQLPVCENNLFYCVLFAFTFCQLTQSQGGEIPFLSKSNIYRIFRWVTN